MIRSECVLKVGVIGLSHKTADLTFREAMARGADSLAGERALFFFHPIAILSTCNRMEIYFGGDDLASIHSDLLEWLRKYIPESFEHRLYSYFGIDCFAHLSRVAAGLDSAIVAETEICAQVKSAYRKACLYSHLPSCMHYVFQKALKIGRLARNRVQIDRSAPTLCQAVWRLALQTLGSLFDRRILLIGYSDINRMMAHFLLRRKVASLFLATQNPSAVAIKGCSAVDRSEIDRWPEYDLIISASDAGRYLVKGSSAKKQAIFDLSVPRTVDPQVKGAIALYNIEEINRWIQEKRALNEGQAAQCCEFIWGETIRAARIYREKVLFSEKVFV